MDSRIRLVHIDALRIIACFFVIVNHTNNIMKATSPSPTWYISLVYWCICKTAVPIFVIIMGGVSLGRVDRIEKHYSRIIRCVQLLLLATFFYTYYNLNRAGKQIKLMDVAKGLLGSANGHLWYLYLWLGLLLFLFCYQRLSVSLDKSELEHLIIFTLVFGGGFFQCCRCLSTGFR